MFMPYHIDMYMYLLLELRALINMSVCVLNCGGYLLLWIMSVLEMSYLLMFVTAFSCIPLTG
jgi:hypothetical protein